MRYHGEATGDSMWEAWGFVMVFSVKEFLNFVFRLEMKEIDGCSQSGAWTMLGRCNLWNLEPAIWRAFIIFPPAWIHKVKF